VHNAPAAEQRPQSHRRLTRNDDPERHMEFAHVALRKTLKPSLDCTTMNFAAITADPYRWPWNGSFSSGGPTYDVIDIYKAAAPHIDFAAPDIYMMDSKKFSATLDVFQRPDNPLMMPEMSNAADYVRYAYLVLGRGSMGFSPFGIDYTTYSNFPLGAKTTGKPMVEPFGRVYAAFRPMERRLPDVRCRSASRPVGCWY